MGVDRWGVPGWYDSYTRASGPATPSRGTRGSASATRRTSGTPTIGNHGLGGAPPPPPLLPLLHPHVHSSQKAVEAVVTPTGHATNEYTYDLIDFKQLLRCGAAGGGGNTRCSKEPELVLVHRDKHVLGLAVVVEHHLVRLAPEAALLVPAERGVCRICVVAVDPHAARLDGARHLVHLVRVAGPDPGPEAVPRP